MKKAFFYSFLAIFVLTSGVTLLGVTNVVAIKEGYLNALFGSLILELITAMIALFRATRFFEDSLYRNVMDYEPSRDAARVLHTLLIYQDKMDPQMKTKFGFVVAPGSGDFPRFLNGLAELVGMGFVDVDRERWMCCFTSTGYRFANYKRKKIQDVGDFIV